MENIEKNDEQAYSLGFKVGTSIDYYATATSMERGFIKNWLSESFIKGLFDGRAKMLSAESNKQFFKDASGHMVYREKIKVSMPLKPWLNGLSEISSYSPTEPEQQ